LTSNYTNVDVIKVKILLKLRKCKTICLSLFQFLLVIPHMCVGGIQESPCPNVCATPLNG